MFMRRIPTQTPRRRWVAGFIVGVAASVSLLTMNAVTSPPEATTVAQDHGVDQIPNGHGSCTTTVAGWVSIPNDNCGKRLPQPVRQCVFNVTGSAILGILFGNPGAGAAGAALGCAGGTL
jgi:hypothetical protein